MFTAVEGFSSQRKVLECAMTKNQSTKCQFDELMNPTKIKKEFIQAFLLQFIPAGIKDTK